MSSPFRVAHRRSRSHTSLTSPSSPPIPQGSDKRRSHAAAYQPLLISKNAHTASTGPFDSPSIAASSFTAQPLEKWDVEAWRHGKRARRDPEGSFEDADMESCDEPMSTNSPLPEPQPLSSPLSMSAPSTPLPRFASTSDAFQFFPSKSSSSPTKPSGPSALFSGSTIDHNEQADNLARIQSEAFDDLRKTVSEAGEGFVRRMREFEAHRSRGPNRSSTSPSQLDSSSNKFAPHKRGRKRPSPLSARQWNVQRANVGRARGKESDSEDGESDVEIRSGRASGPDDFRGYSPSKKRAVSLSALYYQDAIPATHPFPIPLRSRSRSSSPSESDYSDSSSDEDEEIASSSGITADRRRRRRALRFRSKPVSSVKSSPPPLSFSFSTSNSSSHLSLGASVPSPISLTGCSKNAFSPTVDDQSTQSASDVGLTPGIFPGRPASPFQTSKSTEKAVAALTLALANGAGSVSDYEALRNAQGVLAMDDAEVGSLWD